MEENGFQQEEDIKNLAFSPCSVTIEGQQQITPLLNENDLSDKKVKSSDDDENFTWFNIVSFAFAGMPYYLMLTAIGIYVNKFLLDENKILPKNTSIILMVSGAIDGITDPIYGHLINISPLTKFGKMKPWYENLKKN